MKNTLKYISFGIALLASSLALNAQGTYHREGGMATSKKVEGPTNGYYTITLESFATGESTITENATPVDIVLVLDVSGSMNDNMYTYTARNSQAYTYSSYGNNTYYYLHTDGNYYEVSRNENNGRYYLRFQTGQDNNTRHYLHGTEVTPDNTRPGDAPNNQNSTIWTGVLYTRTNAGTKLDNLKTAVQKFVNTVNHNANFDSKDQPRGTPLTNRIAVVKYAGARYYNSNQNSNSCFNAPNASNLSAGNNRYNSYGYSYNYTEVLVGFTDVSTTDGVNQVIGTGNYTGVTDIISGGATSADFGLYKATFLLETVKNDDSNKVVVLFTDGEPNHSSGFDDDVADDAISIASTLKKTYGATVFTIGVFDNETDDIKNYMNWTSSNYPDQTGWDDNGSTTTPAENSYYQNASGANLDDIFEFVAHASAAADAKAGATTQVRDVISNSFIMPAGNTAGITFKTAEIKEDGSGWKTPVEATGVTYRRDSVTTTTGEKHLQLVVQGFDYTAPDTYNEDGFTVTPGNWVGERYSDATTHYWAGKKLIIEFKIEANDEATGGDGTATNHPDSGIYVQAVDSEGNPVWQDEEKTIPVYNPTPVNKYDVPHTPLPLLIKITKDGLRHGESATFQLLRIRPLGWNDDGETLEEKMANVEYNAIGKPKPGTHVFDPTVYDKDGNPKPGETLDPNDPMDYLEGIGWIDWSKVILTNKGADKASVTKTLFGLDPGWVYMVVEDDWGWAYTLTGSSSSETTSTTEINPFRFHNEAKTNVVKHAEAVTINHFETRSGQDSLEEHYKSSKTNFETR